MNNNEKVGSSERRRDSRVVCNSEMQEEGISTGGCRNGALDERIDLQPMMGVVPCLTIMRKVRRVRGQKNRLFSKPKKMQD